MSYLCFDFFSLFQIVEKMKAGHVEANVKSDGGN